MHRHSEHSTRISLHPKTLHLLLRESTLVTINTIVSADIVLGDWRFRVNDAEPDTVAAIDAVRPDAREVLDAATPTETDDPNEVPPSFNDEIHGGNGPDVLFGSCALALLGTHHS